MLESGLRRVLVDLFGGTLRQTGLISGIIVSGGTTTEQLNLNDNKLTGIIIPTITSGNITFSVSEVSGGTFRGLKNANNIAMTIGASVGNIAVADAELMNALAPWKHVKIIAQTQADDRYFIVVTKV